MAEKRIRIEQFEYEGFGHCGGFTTDGKDYFCEFGGESIPINKEFCEKKCPYDNSISRQEAIEKMAKALIRADYPHAQESIWDMRWNNPASKDYYLIMANSALNSLLEE